MQYPNRNYIFFPNWKIISFDVDNNKIHHSVSTYKGSSDSPIIRRWEDNYILGLYFCGYTENENKFIYNLATPFDIIINDIKNQYNIKSCVDNNEKNKNYINKAQEIINEIECIYITEDDNNTISLLHDYNVSDFTFWCEEVKKSYLETKKVNIKFYEDNIEL